MNTSVHLHAFETFRVSTMLSWKLAGFFIVMAALAVPETMTVGTSKTCNGTFIRRQIGYLEQMSVVSDGDYMLQILLTVTGDDKCSTVARRGMQLFYATKYAIDMINKRKDILPNSSLGFRLDDVCYKLPFAMKRGLDIASHYRPNSVCRPEYGTCDVRRVAKKMSAVVGTGRSSSTIPLASLLALYSVPQVSFSASSRLLSDKKNYGSFFRTMPSDTGQAEAMLDILEHFSWNYVFAVGSSDDYGKLGVAELKRLSNSRNVCIAREEYISYNEELTPKDAVRIIELIKNFPRAKVVILFTFSELQGEHLLQQAHKEGVQRIWLTSETWNPHADRINAPLEQLHGILTVSLPTYELHGFRDFVEQSIESDWSCEPWLRMLIRNKFNCNVTQLDRSILLGEQCSRGLPCQQCKVPLVDLTDFIVSPMTYQVTNLIDAVDVLALALHNVRQQTCPTNTSCQRDVSLAPELATNILFNVSFVNSNNLTIEFDANGDPSRVSYVITNLQIDRKGNKNFAPVGTWNYQDGKGKMLHIQNDQIYWPAWSEQTPSSVCSTECQPGWYVVGKSACCWGCQKCPSNTISQATMSDNCTECPSVEDYYTNDQHTECLKYEILHIHPTGSSGVAIISVSVIGIICLLLCSAVMIKYRSREAILKSSPGLLIVIVACIGVSFGYGICHTFKPTEFLCKIQSAYFLAMYMFFSAILLVKTKLVISRIEKRSIGVFCGQITIVLFLAFTELLTLGVWSIVGDESVVLTAGQKKGDKWLECPFQTDALKLVTIAMPCAVLLTATYAAVRERNLPHVLYEPKFISFTTTAMCIIVSAFLPTFRYVVGIYKSLVAAFVADLSLFLLMVCLVVPTLYAAVTNKNMTPPPQEQQLSFSVSGYSLRESSERTMSRSSSSKKKESVISNKSVTVSPTETTSSA